MQNLFNNNYLLFFIILFSFLSLSWKFDKIIKSLNEIKKNGDRINDAIDCLVGNRYESASLGGIRDEIQRLNYSVDEINRKIEEPYIPSSEPDFVFIHKKDSPPPSPAE